MVVSTLVVALHPYSLLLVLLKLLSEAELIDEENCAPRHVMITPRPPSSAKWLWRIVLLNMEANPDLVTSTSKSYVLLPVYSTSDKERDKA